MTVGAGLLLRQANGGGSGARASRHGPAALRVDSDDASAERRSHYTFASRGRRARVSKPHGAAVINSRDQAVRERHDACSCTADMLLGGKYKVGDLIGSGGMGDVYCAEQPDLARTVAVKLLRHELRTDPHMRRRFHTEATVGARLRHHNLVAVLDFGLSEDGVPYLVLEHVRGKPVSLILAAEGSLPVARAARLAADVLAGLAEAHAEGVVHADIKSDNVMIDRYRDGTEVAKLLDFGLARFVGEPPLQSAADATLSSTPEYLAPEVIRGVLPSPASDVYSAGAMLYELLTGTTPFRASDIPEILRRHLEEDVVPPSSRSADRYIPGAIDTVVMCALAKDPTERYRDAEQFRRALLAAMPAKEPVPPRADELTFVSEPTRRDMRPDVERRFAAGSRPQPPRDTGDLQRALGLAITRGDLDQIVAGYLELAGVLVDARQLMAAAKELEEAIDLITHGGGPAAPNAPEPLWRLLLALASIYAGLGDPLRALDAARAGRRHAERQDSAVGRTRARALAARLGLRL